MIASEEQSDGPRVTFTLRPEDMRAFDDYIRKKIGTPWMVLVVWAVLVLASGFWLRDAFRGNMRYDPGNPLIFPLWFVFPCSMVVCLYMQFRRQSYSRPEKYEKQTPGIFQPRTVGVGGKGIYQKDATGEGWTNWSMVTDVADTDSHIFLWYSSKIGLAIPKRAFSERALANAFVDQARQHWRSGAQQAS